MEKSIKTAIVPNRVSELRKEHGLTQQDLADMLFIDKRTMSRIECGAYFTLDTLIRVADMFGVTLDYIMLRTENRVEPPTELDEIELEIFAQIKGCSIAEKERLIKHLALENTLKLTNNG